MSHTPWAAAATSQADPPGTPNTDTYTLTMTGAPIGGGIDQTQFLGLDTFTNNGLLTTVDDVANDRVDLTAGVVTMTNYVGGGGTFAFDAALNGPGDLLADGPGFADQLVVEGDLT